MEKLYILPDSNIFMHYTNWQDYPWLSHPEFQGKHLTVVFSAPVIEELNRNKDTNARNAIQRRCRTLLSWLEKNLGGRRGEELEVRPGLSCALDMFRYDTHRGKNPDERLIEYANERMPSAVIFSHDAGLRLGALETGIQAVDPLAEQRFPDNEGSEISRLRSELKKYENRTAKLRLSSPQGFLHFCPQNLPVSLEEFVDERVRAHRADMAGRKGIAVENFLSEMASYAKIAYISFTRVLHSARFELVICNEGTAPVESAKVVVTADEGPLVEEPLMCLALPDQPERPAENTYIGPSFSSPPLKPGQTWRAKPNWSRVSGTKASYVMGSLLHGDEVHLPELALVPSWTVDAIRNQEVVVKVLYDGAATPAVFRFGVVEVEAAEPVWDSESAYIELLEVVETWDEMFRRLDS